MKRFSFVEVVDTPVRDHSSMIYGFYGLPIWLNAL